MPTPLIVAAPLRPGLRSVDEQGRFIEAAEVFELKGEAKVRQMVVDGSMTAAMQVTDEVLPSSIKMSKAEVKALIESHGEGSAK